MEPKKPYLSKTIILNAIVTLAGVLSSLGVPVIGDFVKTHSDILLLSLGGIGIALRLVTKGAISLE